MIWVAFLGEIQQVATLKVVTCFDSAVLCNENHQELN